MNMEAFAVGKKKADLVLLEMQILLIVSKILQEINLVLFKEVMLLILTHWWL